MTRYRAYLDFDLSQVDPEARELVSARLSVPQSTETQGEPFTALGPVYVAPVDFGATLEPEDWSLPVGPAQVLSQDMAEGSRTVDVTAAMAARWDARATGGSLLQFRLAFDENAAPRPGNMVTFYAGESGFLGPHAVLLFEYLAP